MTLRPPVSLLYLMGGWAAVTGVLGFLANGAAICVFCRTRKVQHFSQILFLGLIISAPHTIQLVVDEPLPDRAEHCLLWKLNSCLQLFPGTVGTFKLCLPGKCIWNDLSR